MVLTLDPSLIVSMLTLSVACLEVEVFVSLERVAYVSRFCSLCEDLLGVDLGEKL